jgi:hypothetical protein
VKRTPANESSYPNQDYAIREPQYQGDGPPPPNSFLRPARPGLEVLPYRGQEYHGVNPNQAGDAPDISEDVWDQYSVIPHNEGDDEPRVEVRPVPVRVVRDDNDTYEYPITRIFQMGTSGQPERVVGRDIRRQNFTIQNTGTVDLYVSTDVSPSVVNAFAVHPNGSQQFNGQNSFYCVTADGSSQTASVIVERVEQIPRQPDE